MGEQEIVDMEMMYPIAEKFFRAELLKSLQGSLTSLPGIYGIVQVNLRLYSLILQRGLELFVNCSQKWVIIHYFKTFQIHRKLDSDSYNLKYKVCNNCDAMNTF